MRYLSSGRLCRHRRLQMDAIGDAALPAHAGCIAGFGMIPMMDTSTRLTLTRAREHIIRSIHAQESTAISIQ